MTKNIAFLIGAVLLMLSFISCNKDLTIRENKLEGLWQYRVVKETPKWDIGCDDLSDEWSNDQLEFVLPDQVFYYDAETGDKWEGTWQLERDTDVATSVDGETNSNIDYVLTMTLIHPTNGELVQMTADLVWISKSKMRIIDYQRDKTTTYRLDKQ